MRPAPAVAKFKLKGKFEPTKDRRSMTALLAILHCPHEESGIQLLGRGLNSESLSRTSEAEFVDPESSDLGFQRLARETEFQGGALNAADSSGGLL